MTIRAWLGVAACGGLLALSACKNRQEGWPDPSQGNWGFVTWCDGDRAAEEDMSDQSDPLDPYDPFNDPASDEVPCYPLADAVAVSAKLHPGYVLSDVLPAAIDAGTIESASAEYLALSSGGWVALREGEVGLLAIGSGTVLDYKMLSLRLVDEIELDTPEQLPMRESISIHATPRGQGEPLAGLLAWEWRAVSEGLEVVSSWRHTAVIEITTQDPVTLEVSAGGYTETITLQAYPGPMRVPAGGGQ